MKAHPVHLDGSRGPSKKRHTRGGERLLDSIRVQPSIVVADDRRLAVAALRLRKDPGRPFRVDGMSTDDTVDHVVAEPDDEIRLFGADSADDGLEPGLVDEGRPGMNCLLYTSPSPRD